MKIAVAGGDLRMKTTHRLLAEYGFETAAGQTKGELLEAVKKADVVILPMPCIKNGALNAPFIAESVTPEELVSSLNEKALCIGGYLPKGFPNSVDYALREDLLLKNAAATAESAVGLAIKETKITLFGSNAVVLGYGRIGSHLSSLLKAFGANVTIAARSLKSRAQAAVTGIRAVGFDEIEAPLSDADIVFNTVPSEVLGEKKIEKLNPEALIIDLASAPGGVDAASAEKHGIRSIHALALPGKTSPVSAGRFIFETVISILREREMLE